MGLGESQRQDQGVSSTWRVSTEETLQPGREGWRVGPKGEQGGSSVGLPRQHLMWPQCGWVMRSLFQEPCFRLGLVPSSQSPYWTIGPLGTL